MSMSQNPVGPNEAVAAIPNGPGAAAILGAGIGSAALGILVLAGDASPAIKEILNFYNPTGRLSGVTTVTIIVWLVAWYILFLLWRGKAVALAKVNVVAFVLLAVGFLLTFPPFLNLLQGR